MKKRILSILLICCMVLTMLPATALAEESRQTGGGVTASGLCEHHPAHDDECGYTEGTAGTPCSHEHTDDCYTEVTDCVHEHTEDCYPQNSVSGNNATSSNADEPTECTHVCSEESGCITKQLNCQHEHDEDCGYTPATAGTPCGYVCEICGAEGNAAEAMTVERVQAMIDALPDAEEITEDNAEEVTAQLEAIDEAKAELTDEEIDELDITRYMAAAAALGSLAAPMLLANAAPAEQFNLTPGGTYWFDLSGENIPGTVNTGTSFGAVSVPDTTLHYVPFTYAGTVDAYKLTSEMVTTEDYATQNKYPHSLFVADYAVTHTVSWDELNNAGLIFGKSYTGGSVDYTLRAPSAGSWHTGSYDLGTPQSNEWDAVLDKNSGYIKNWNGMFSWGQDTSSSSYSATCAERGYYSARYWYHYYATTYRAVNVGFRPVLEVLHTDTLGSDGLKAVTLDLNGGKLGGSTDTIQIIVKNGAAFTAPASDGLTAPQVGYSAQWQDSDGNLYAPGDSVPADVTTLTAQWTDTYTVTLNKNGGTIASGKDVTEYTYGTGATLPTAGDITRAGHTFEGWYEDENFSGSPVTEISATDTGKKEFYAKWTLNTYTVTFDSQGGSKVDSQTVSHGGTVTEPTAPTYEGYTFGGWYTEAGCTTEYDFTTAVTESLTLYAKWKDVTCPTGEITVDKSKWNTFFNNITFGLFFKDTQKVTITASDNSGDNVTITYLLSDKELTVDELNASVFTAYTGAFYIEPNNEYVIYAKLTDSSGNICYINSNGVVLDNVDPLISGIIDGKTYCEAQTVTIDEKYVDSVTVDGTAVTLTDGKFTLSPADGKQTIVVTDKAGNKAEMTVTVNDGHTGGTATCTEKAKCEVCGTAYGEINANNHTDLKHIKAKAATKNAEGNIEYWYCEDCGKYFSDADAKNEITKAATVIAKLTDDTKSPQTGDNSHMVLWFALLFVSCGGIITTIYIGKRKKKKSE